jgi:hypothetical protein
LRAWMTWKNRTTRLIGERMGWVQALSDDIVRTFVPSVRWQGLRESLIDDLLPGVVDDALASPELSDAIQDHDLDRDELRAAVINDKWSAVTPAWEELDALVNAWQAAGRRDVVDEVGGTRPRNPRAVWNIVVGCYLIVAPPVAIVWLWSALPWWLLLPLVVVALNLMGAGVKRLDPIVSFLTPTTVPNLNSLRTGFGGRDSNYRSCEARWRRSVCDEGVFPRLRQEINQRIPHAEMRWARLTVSANDAPGLRDARNGQIVHTSVVDAFGDLLGRFSAGAIGLAGPRGAGKTALIRYLAATADTRWPDADPVIVQVAAPVQYEAKDFVLHLHASVCRRVIDRYRLMQEERRAPLRHFVRRRLLRNAVRGVAGAVLAWLAALPVLGLGAILDPAEWWAHVHGADLWLIPAGLLAVFAAIHLCVGLVQFAELMVLFAARPLLVRLLGQRAERDGWRRAVQHARANLENIRFLQTHTSGWSSRLVLPFGADAGRMRSIQRARQPVTHPEVVEEFSELLKAVSATTQVIISIDELDKIDSAERAAQFVNEIKTVFGAPKTLFIIAVSEDALAAYERRGLPVRDAFDSAFDEILRLDRFNLNETRLLLRSHVIGLPASFTLLTHCLSGGLPREAIRVARSLVSLGRHGEAAPTLEAVCERVVADDLRARVHAFAVAAAGLAEDVGTGEFLLALRSLRANAPVLIGSLARLAPTSAGTECRPFSLLRIQAAVYAYHCATVLEVFTAAQMKRLAENPEFAIGLQSDTAPGVHFEALAEAKQAMALDSELAWTLINECRAGLAMDVHAVPTTG